MALSSTSTNATQITTPLAPLQTNDSTRYVVQSSSDFRRYWSDSAYSVALTSLNAKPTRRLPPLGLSSRYNLCHTLTGATTLEANRNRGILSEASKPKSRYGPQLSYNQNQSIKGKICQDNINDIDSWSAACMEPDKKPYHSESADSAQVVRSQTMKYKRANGSIGKKVVPVNRGPTGHPGSRRHLRHHMQPVRAENPMLSWCQEKTCWRNGFCRRSAGLTAIATPVETPATI